MVKEFIPKSELLSRYIYEFYVIPEGTELSLSYYAFPQKGTSMALYKNTQKRRSKEELILSPLEREKPEYNIELLGKYLIPVKVTYEGFVNEIAINFKPLGINYFFAEPFLKLAPDHFQELEQADWKNALTEIFASATDVESIEKLEAFLEKQVLPEKDEVLAPYEKAIDLLNEVEEEYNISEIAAVVGVNEKTFLRNFKKYAGCTPVQLKRILRFRRSIDLQKLNDESGNLTTTALESLFYDSSHFGREYRLLTGESPKHFFNHVSFQKGNKYPYRFT